MKNENLSRWEINGGSEGQRTVLLLHSLDPRLHPLHLLMLRRHRPLQRLDPPLVLLPLRVEVLAGELLLLEDGADTLELLAEAERLLARLRQTQPASHPAHLRSALIRARKAAKMHRQQSAAERTERVCEGYVSDSRSASTASARATDSRAKCSSASNASSHECILRWRLPRVCQ